METISNFFSQNPMVTYSILIFVVCLFIGYFGNKYIENQKQIRNMEKIQEKENDYYTQGASEINNNVSQSNNDNVMQNGAMTNENPIINTDATSDVDKNLQPFDGTITNDDNINNMF